jgi:hypothetical protein
MKRFDVTKLRDGDILCGRNLVSAEGKLIRATLGSTNNHNALIVTDQLTHRLGVGDMTPPCSMFVPLSVYEAKVFNGEYRIQILRIKDATPTERRKMSLRWDRLVKGHAYSSYGVKRLWAFRFVNSLPWHIKGKWCTRVVGTVCAAVFPARRNIFRKIFVAEMPLKKNETPRTVENRLVQGLLVDVTDAVFVDDGLDTPRR